MGLVSFGVPREIVVKLSKLNHSNCFVETGTYEGKTSRWAASQFDSVHTIERSEIVYNKFGPALDVFPNLKRHLADSRVVLPKIITQFGNNTGIFWLDGHWSGGDTAGANDECPLLDELACLATRTSDIILIDDARLYLCAPPKPHNPAQWPTVDQIIGAIPNFAQTRFLQIIDDVIFIIPKQRELCDCLIEYAQDCAARGNASPNKKRSGMIKSLFRLS